MAATINGVDMGRIDREETTKRANLIVLPDPNGNSNKTDVFDYGGVTRDVSIEGMKSTPNGASDARTFKNSLENLVNGNQAGSYALISDMNPNPGINVKIMEVNTVWEGGNPNMIRYRTRMTESTTTS